MEKFVEKGKIIVTDKIAERMESDNNFYRFVVTSFERYRHGDWGDTCEEDARQNDYALTHDERILACYIYDEEDIRNYLKSLDKGIYVFKFKKTSEKNPDGEKIWIITEPNRDITAILFMREYQKEVRE